MPMPRGNVPFQIPAELTAPHKTVQDLPRAIRLIQWDGEMKIPVHRSVEIRGMSEEGLPETLGFIQLCL